MEGLLFGIELLKVGKDVCDVGSATEAGDRIGEGLEAVATAYGVV